MSNATNIIGQPEQTLIEKVIKAGPYKIKSREQIPIGELEVGDIVSSYSFKDAAIYTRVVTRVETNNFDGNLISFKVDGQESLYTPDNSCIVRYRDRSNDYCIYVMQKGSAFRVGMSKIWYEDAGCGPYKRLTDEDGDNLWILKTFPSRQLALVEETKVSIKFRLPQTMFLFKETRGSWTKEEFEYVWKDICNIEDAENALKYYGRSIKYPYFIKSKDSISIKRPHIVNVCNILDNSEMYVKNTKWTPITTISSLPYKGIIYNIHTNNEGNYFANNILTHGNTED